MDTVYYVPYEEGCDGVVRRVFESSVLFSSYDEAMDACADLGLTDVDVLIMSFEEGEDIPASYADDTLASDCTEYSMLHYY